MHRLAIFLCVLVLSTAVLCEDPPNSKLDHSSDYHSMEHHNNHHDHNNDHHDHLNDHHDHHNDHRDHQNDHQKPPGPPASAGKMPEMPKTPDVKMPNLSS